MFLSLSRISVVTKLKLNPLKSKTIWPGSYFRPGLEVRLRLHRFSLVVLKILNAIPLPVITKNYYPRQEDILPKDFVSPNILFAPISHQFCHTIILTRFLIKDTFEKGYCFRFLNNNIILSFDYLGHFKGQLFEEYCVNVVWLIRKLPLFFFFQFCKDFTLFTKIREHIKGLICE